MVILSRLSQILTKNNGKILSSLSKTKLLTHQVPRQMSDHGQQLFQITPSRWQWHRFKDLLHYYLMVGLIPVGAVVFYANVFIGPATLTEIPEDHIPKHWEYYRHPITRFLARYLVPSYQEDYEKFMHCAYEEDEKAKIRGLEQQIIAKMGERQDYKAYYYRPAYGKYARLSKEAAEELESLRGD